MTIFFDSSALTKRFLHENGSARVEEIWLSVPDIGVSMLTWTEVVSALCRRRREGALTDAGYARGRRELDEDLRDCIVLELSNPVLRHAVRLLEAFPLRSSDAVQIASALVWRADLFLSADRRQCTAARGVGLIVEELPAGAD